MDEWRCRPAISPRSGQTVGASTAVAYLETIDGSITAAIEAGVPSASAPTTARFVASCDEPADFRVSGESGSSAPAHS
jgi:hypothetical protein